MSETPETPRIHDCGRDGPSRCSICSPVAGATFRPDAGARERAATPETCAMHKHSLPCDCNHCTYEGCDWRWDSAPAPALREAETPDDLCARCGARRDAAKHSPGLFGIRGTHEFQPIAEAGYIATLRARISELERDAERLDWLAQHAVAVERRLDGHGGTLPGYCITSRYASHPEGRGDTPREAIDAARGATDSPAGAPVPAVEPSRSSPLTAVASSTYIVRPPGPAETP